MRPVSEETAAPGSGRTIASGSEFAIFTEISIDYQGDATFTHVPTNLALPPGNPLGLPAGTSVDQLL